MPGLIAVRDFVREVREDFNSPTTSNFVNRIPQCRESVCKMDESLSADKEGLMKLKNSVKDICKAGNNHAASEMDFSKALNRLGEMAIMRDDEPDDIGAAFQKFAVVTKELSNLTKNLMQNLDSILLFPVDRLLKTELRGSKGDLKRPFERSWKDYHEKYAELERQKKKAAKEAGLHRSELTAGEIADEMDKERKYLQLSTAEYFIRINEIRTKKGVNLLQQMLEFYRTQFKYFSEGLETIEHFGNYIEDLSTKLGKIQENHDDERRSLVDIRNTLKNSPGFSKVVNGSTGTLGHGTGTAGAGTTGVGHTGTGGGHYTLHQAKGDAAAGSRKSGYLNKRSEGRLRNVWQKRKCQAREGFLEIYHADEAKPPTQVNLLTCQMKPVADERTCFDVVSYNRTYHFQAENEPEKEEWMSVLLNSKEASLNQAFEDNGTNKSGQLSQGLRELQRALVAFIRGMPGNDKCCDCGSNNDATWLSTNFGVIVCIECSGIHREMGVHVSKIQSLTLDNLGTSQLLVARVMTNEGFNKVMEARLLQQQQQQTTVKPQPNSSMDDRKAFIKAKYEERKFLQPLCQNASELFCDLEQAIDSHSLYDLVQSVTEATLHGVDITDALPTSEFAETSLHHAISQETGHSLHIVDFLVQNSASLDRQTREGNTPLHYCVIQNQCESMRLLLRSGANPGLENNNGKTPLDIAKERGHRVCEEMLLHALQRKKTMFDNVNIDWHLSSHDEGSTDFSDDETLLDSGGANDRLNGSRTPDEHSHLHASPDGSGILRRPLSVYTPTNSHHRGLLTTVTATPTSAIASATVGRDWHNMSSSAIDWSRSSGDVSAASEAAFQQRLSGQMPPPPPPQGKKPTLFGSQTATSSDTSPPLNDESSPENRTSVLRLRNRQSTESLDSLSDESGSHHQNRSRGSAVGVAGGVTGTPAGGGALGANSSVLNSGGRNPVPPPRKRNDFGNLRRCRALYDCEADNEDELTFEEGDVILIINEETEDENWMEGVLETDASRRGLFPVSFVHILTD